MKITAFIILVLCLHVSAATLAQNVTLSEHKASLEKVIGEIKQQTGYSFFYNEDWLKQAQPVDLDVKNSPLEKALELCFSNQPFSYAIVNKTIVLKLKPQPKVEVAVPVNVSGRVTDSLGTSLIGATITNKTTNKSTITDDKGEFNISGQNGDQIIVTFVGFRPYNFTITNDNSFQNITLHASSSKLSEVVVSTGYQTLPLERATGSFATVDNKLFNREVGKDVIGRLEGIVPGMLFNHNTAASQSSNPYDINVDGHSTLFSNDQPLIVVDNFAYDGNFNNINPNDVESITVLKDAAAASIWGVRSGNGVIVITTKKGKRNQKMKVGFNANVTIGNKPNLFYGNNFLDANDYINIEQKLFNAGYYNGQLGVASNVTSPVVQLLAQEKAGTLSASDATNQINALRNNDVRNDLTKYFYQKMVNQQYAANFTGGGENSDYYFSMGYDNDLANLVGNANNRLSIKSSYNFYPVKNLQFSVGLNYTQQNSQNNSELPAGNINPYTQLADANGNPLVINNTYAPSYIATMQSKGFLNWQFSPLADQRLQDNTAKDIDNLIKLGVNYKFLKDFSANVLYQYERESTDVLNDNSISTYYTRNLINRFTKVNSNGTLTYPIPLGGILQQQDRYLNSQQARAQLDYNHSWNKDNSVSAIVGTEIRSAVTTSNSSTAYGYDKNTDNSISGIDFADSFPNNPRGGSQIPNSSFYSKGTNNFISYYSNAAYTYKSTYIFSLSGRIDHSNLFGVNTNQKAVPLYTAGFAWDLSKENFYHLDFLPFLKPRLTYGYTANINTSATAVTTTTLNGSNVFNNIPNANVNNPGNPDLQWEKNRKINFGLDYATHNNILSGSFDYYWKKGINLFGSSQLAPSTGLLSFFGNASGTAGHGIDVVLNSKNIDFKNFHWTTNFLLSNVQDKVTNYNVTTTATNLLQNGSGNGGVVVPVVGAPIFGLYSYKWGGLTNSTGDPQGYLNGQLSTDWASIIKNTPISGLVYDGPSRPTTFGSFRNNFSYKQLTLSFNIKYEFNFYFRKSSVSDVGGITSVDGLGFGNSDYLKAWQKPGDELITNVPSMTYPPFNVNRENFYKYSSILIDKGDNIRLQDISISYDLDKAQLRRLPFSHFEIYGYITNLGILWRANKDHLDPDLFYSSSIFITPNPRTVAFGIKADFK